MESSSAPQVSRVLIVKSDRLYADLLRTVVKSLLPAATVTLAHSMEMAARAIASEAFDLLLAGVDQTFNGDVLQLIAQYHRSGPLPQRRVFAIGAQMESHVITVLHLLAVRGVFDASTDCPETLRAALNLVLSGGRYCSRSVAERMRRNPPAVTSGCEHLSMTEQLVLSLLADGSDDGTAAHALGVSPATISTVRRKLHRKLQVQHRGELIRVAAQNGFVHFTPFGVVRPGFTLLAEECLARKRKRRATAAAAVAAFLTEQPV